MQPNANVALRKRTQISKANRTMFIWIAASAAVVGAALVIAFTLTQQLFYNEKVLAEKNTTIDILKNNNAVVPELESQVRALDASAVLASAKAKPNDQALQVILDALPADANDLALGGSLQNKLLAGISGLKIESLNVDSFSTDGTTEDASVSASGTNQITFQFAVSGNQTALKKVLTNLERSIRAIDILSLRIESQGSTQLMSVQARAFYEPARTLELRDKVVRP